MVHLPMNMSRPSGVCTFCHKSLNEEAVIAMNKLWHREHFLCVNCDNPIQHGFKRDDDDRPLCITCHTNIYNPKCFSCGHTLQDQCIVAGDKPWHKRCFVCTCCKQPFPNGEYFLFEGLPYDVDCHWSKRLQLHLALMVEQQGREEVKKQ